MFQPAVLAGGRAPLAETGPDIGQLRHRLGDRPELLRLGFRVAPATARGDGEQQGGAEGEANHVATLTRRHLGPIRGARSRTLVQLQTEPRSA